MRIKSQLRKISTQCLAQDWHSKVNSPTSLQVTDQYPQQSIAPVNHAYQLKTEMQMEKNNMINGRQLLILVMAFLYAQFRTDH